MSRIFEQVAELASVMAGWRRKDRLIPIDLKAAVQRMRSPSRKRTFLRRPFA